MTREAFRICLFLFMSLPWLLCGQAPYPFSISGIEKDQDIMAYWYNVPSEKNVNKGKMGSTDFQSSLHVYGKIPGESFKVSVQVFLKNNKKVFENAFDLNRSEESEVATYNGDYFRLRHRVEYLPDNPQRIVVTIESANSKRSKDIMCRYHKISGKVTDFNGNPLKAFIGICPDAFIEFIGKYSDSEGNYEVELPERTYNALIASTERYGVSQTESWAWHVINDSDQTLNFAIGNDEVYNLNVWTSNGGDLTYFLSFRPMVLEWVFSQGTNPIRIGQKELSLITNTPELEASDIKVTVNEKELPIISVQKFYETGYSKYAFAHYIVQADHRGVISNKKLNILLEFRKDMEWQGKKVTCFGMGQLQVFPNFNGLSPIFSPVLHGPLLVQTVLQGL
jgi:hypothetical protein